MKVTFVPRSEPEIPQVRTNGLAHPRGQCSGVKDDTVRCPQCRRLCGTSMFRGKSVCLYCQHVY